MANLFAISDFYRLAFPGVLLVFYVVCWLAVGRDPKIGNVAPRYEPPAGISPGVARYILTGGSDGTTLAAVLAGLAAKGVVAIQPQGGSYAVSLLNSSPILLPEEASLVRTIFNVVSTVQPYADSNTAILGEASFANFEPANIRQSGEQHFAQSCSCVDARQRRFERKDGWGRFGRGCRAVAVTGKPCRYRSIGCGRPSRAILMRCKIRSEKTFREFTSARTSVMPALAWLPLCAWAMFTAATLEASSSMFITFWLLMFTSIAGLVIGGVWTSKPSRPSAKQRVTRVLVPVLFFGLPGAVIYFAALPQSHGFVLALLLSVMLNSIFFVIMRAPTPRGLMILQQLAGFREFLMRVEQDPLDRVNTPEQRAELMNRFLPYAIALNVREGWGDKMASAFSDAIVER